MYLHAKCFEIASFEIYLHIHHLMGCFGVGMGWVWGGYGGSEVGYKCSMSSHTSF